MNLLLPSGVITYIVIAHAILLVIAAISISNSKLSNLKKFLLLVIALILPVLGSILVSVINLARKQKRNEITAKAL